MFGPYISFPHPRHSFDVNRFVSFSVDENVNSMWIITMGLFLYDVNIEHWLNMDCE